MDRLTDLSITPASRATTVFVSLAAELVLCQSRNAVNIQLNSYASDPILKQQQQQQHQYTSNSKALDQFCRCMCCVQRLANRTTDML